MIIYEKKQQGGTVGKAGRLSVQATDRSAALQYNPQIQEVRALGSVTGSGTTASTQKMYQGMLPSDSDYLKGIKEQKKQEIADKYVNPEYEGSQENINDLEIYRNIDASMASKGKHFATRYTKNAQTIKSRKAEGSMASAGGYVLTEDIEGNYQKMSYKDLMSQTEDGDMRSRPLSVSEAAALRESNVEFNSFGNLGQFVDQILMNTYAPSDLPKTIKAIASQAKSSTIPLDDKGNQMSVIDLVTSINEGGGMVASLKTNARQVNALSNYFNNSIDPGTSDYIDKLAIQQVYNRIAAGNPLPDGETITEAINTYKTNLVNDYFYGALKEDLKLDKKSSGSGSDGPSAQRRYKVNPAASAHITAASQRVKIEVPNKDGKTTEMQEYMGSIISHGDLMFGNNNAYGLPEDHKGGEGKSLIMNSNLARMGGANFDSVAMADGTSINENVGLNDTMLDPNARFHLTFIPVKENSSGKGGYVPDLGRVTQYHEILKEYSDRWAAGEEISPAVIEAELQKYDPTVRIKPTLVFDIILRDNENIDNRLLEEVDNDAIEDVFEDAVGYTRDKKINRTKAFMIVDNPEVYADSKFFGPQFVKEIDVNASKTLAGGLLESLVPITEATTSEDKGTEQFKNGGKVPDADSIHKLLFD